MNKKKKKKILWTVETRNPVLPVRRNPSYNNLFDQLCIYIIIIMLYIISCYVCASILVGRLTRVSSSLRRRNISKVTLSFITFSYHIRQRPRYKCLVFCIHLGHAPNKVLLCWLLRLYTPRTMNTLLAITFFFS